MSSRSAIPTPGSTPPFAGETRGGDLYGRGACDMKAGLVASIQAMDALRASGVRLAGDVILASVQGEEDGGLGTFALLQRGWRADACVVAEPTELDVIPANSGSLTFRLRVPGQATHAARRTEGVSAIEKFWPVWQALVELEQRRHQVVDPLMTRWPLAHPLSIGAVTAGDWASSVPDLLVAEGRLGVALGEGVEHARADLEQTVAELNERDPWHHQHPVELEWWGGQFAPGRLPAGSDLIDRVLAAHAISSSDAGRSQRRRTARPTAATSGCSPGSAASRRCSTGQVTSASPTVHASACRSPTSSPRREPSRCWRSMCAARDSRRQWPSQIVRVTL